MSKVVSANVHSVCPLCGAADSRLHRTRDCPATGHLRTELSLQSSGFVFQEHHWAYGLWSEQDEVRPWQRHLDQVPWPSVPDRISDRVGFLFTDGSCAHPKVKRLRLAAAAVVEAHVDTSHRVLWSGPLPTTCQSIFRAEVLALAMAVASYGEAFICSDNQAAVRLASRLLTYPADQRNAHLPADHTDLWSFFLQCAQHATHRSHRIKWIPAHRDWRALSGRDRVLAFFNDVADRAAKAALAVLVADPMYQQLVTSWFSLTKAAFALAHFHLRVAWLFLGTESSPDRVMPTADALRPVGPSWSLSAIAVGTQRTERFGDILSSWLAQLCWHSSTESGLRDSTPLELLWCFIHDTGCLPPFRVGSVWGGDGAVVAHWLAVPSLPVLWQSWLDSLREVTVNGCPLLRAGRADAAGAWQLGFGDFHVVGFLNKPNIHEDTTLETCLTVSRILVYSLGFMRLLYWHTSNIFRSYRHQERSDLRSCRSKVLSVDLRSARSSQDTEKVCAVKMPRYLMFGNEVFSFVLMLNMIAMMTAGMLAVFSKGFKDRTERIM
eukprot:Skav211942  [mRNA]  locus=scaffold1086:706843:716597:- [translate_table: standard]